MMVPRTTHTSPPSVSIDRTGQLSSLSSCVKRDEHAPALGIWLVCLQGTLSAAEGLLVCRTADRFGASFRSCISGRLHPCRSTSTPTPPATPMTSSELPRPFVSLGIPAAAPQGHRAPSPSQPSPRFAYPMYSLPVHCPVRVHLGAE
ncbi:hypothetical protein N658DRAFT_205616 [Parathielavia hyrcaniae]|uniref:Uncharacterized protein n=1 Tax=Parathielavia hyrcaniae TaxID=113614 RepID=A0AAN6PVS8_9PEZI|nr:hypothetical protein N658DRAFT_205616 [Parathielavia hyrcaniae]